MNDLDYIKDTHPRTLRGTMVRFIMWLVSSEHFDKLFCDEEFKIAWFTVLKKLDEVDERSKV